MKKYHLEYVFKNISAAILWKLVSTPQGLMEWFADDCKKEDDKFIFVWKKFEETAFLIQVEEGVSIRFRWEEFDVDTFFEFQIHTNSLTKDVTLSIIDFAEEDDEEDSKMLWNKQIENLKRNAGL